MIPISSMVFGDGNIVGFSFRNLADQQCVLYFLTSKVSEDD
jgi:hypothetical protein